MSLLLPNASTRIEEAADSSSLFLHASSVRRAVYSVPVTHCFCLLHRVHTKIADRVADVVPGSHHEHGSDRTVYVVLRLWCSEVNEGCCVGRTWDGDGEELEVKHRLNNHRVYRIPSIRVYERSACV